MHIVIKWVVTASCVVFISACVFAPGMRVGDLPPSGKLVAGNGLNIQVEAISTDNIPELQSQDLLTDTKPLFAQQFYPLYKLAPGDVLGITLWENPELTAGVTSLVPAGVGASAGSASTVSNVLPSGSAASGFTIDQDGDISFPLIGRIHAEGESVKSFTHHLEKRLSVYLKQSDAQVRVLAYNGHKFFIDGEVKLPGQYALSDQPQTLYAALSGAGGALPTGDINNIVLIRDGKSYHVGLQDLQLSHLSPNKLFINEGDSIHVYAKENRKLYLLGEAGVPMPLLIPEQGISLSGVIGEGHGLNPLSANPARIYVVRDDVKHNLTKIYHLNLSSLASIALAERFKMRPNDIVYIDASGLARWSRVLGLVLPSAQTLAALTASQYYTNQP